MVRQKGQGSKPASSSQNGDDVSVLRPSITLSSSGTLQVVQALRSGTPEVQNVLLEECDLILECKVCRNMFRGLPNLLAHKRVYCQERYADRESYMEQMSQATVQSHQAETVVILPEAPPQPATPDPLKSEPEEDPWDNQYPDNVIPDKHSKKASTSDGANKKSASGLSGVIDKLKQGTFQGQSQKYRFYTAATAMTESKQEQRTVSEVHLKALEGTSCAMAQRVAKMKEENMDSEGGSSRGECRVPKKRGRKRKRSVLESIDATSESSTDPVNLDCVTVEPVEAKGPLRMCLRERTVDKGQVFQELTENSNCDVKKLLCLICKTTYRSAKTLHFHMTSFHGEKRTFYPCLYCGAIFAQLYSVTRHLIKNHRKTKVQVEKMRDQLKEKSFTRLVDDLGVEKFVGTSNEDSAGGIPCEPKSESPVEKPVQGLGMGLTLQRCKLCPKAFATKESLDAHSERAHPVDRAEDDQGGEDRPDSPASTSSICTRRSSRQAEKSLEKSIEKSIEKKAADNTSVCQYQEVSPALKGISASELRKMAGLIDETALKCLQCKKRYGSLSNLQRHAVRHLGWRRFKCKMCRYTSYNRSECRTHIRKVHAYRVNNLHNYDLAKFIIELDADVMDMQKTRVPRMDARNQSKPTKPLYERFPTVTSAFTYYNVNTRKNARRSAPQSQDLLTLRTRSGVYTKPSFEQLTGRHRDSDQSQSDLDEGEDLEDNKMVDNTEIENEEIVESDKEMQENDKDRQDNDDEMEEENIIVEKTDKGLEEVSNPPLIDNKSDVSNDDSESEKSMDVSDKQETNRESNVANDAVTSEKIAHNPVSSTNSNPQIRASSFSKTALSLNKALSQVVSALKQQNTTSEDIADTTKITPTTTCNVQRCRPIILSQKPQAGKPNIIQTGPFRQRVHVVTSTQLQQIMEFKKSQYKADTGTTNLDSLEKQSTLLPILSTSDGSKVIKLPVKLVTSCKNEASRRSPIVSFLSQQTTCTLTTADPAAKSVSTSTTALPLTSADSDSVRSESPQVEISVVPDQEDNEEDVQPPTTSCSSDKTAPPKTKEADREGDAPLIEKLISQQSSNAECVLTVNTEDLCGQADKSNLQATSKAGDGLGRGNSDITAGEYTKGSDNTNKKLDTSVKVVETVDMPLLAPIPNLVTPSRPTSETTEMPRLSLATEPQASLAAKRPVPGELAVSSPRVEDTTIMTPDSLAPVDVEAAEMDSDRHSDSSFCSQTASTSLEVKPSDPVLSEKLLSDSPCSFCDIKESDSPPAVIDLSPSSSPQPGMSALLPLDIATIATAGEDPGQDTTMLEAKTDLNVMEAKENNSFESQEDLLNFIDRTAPIAFPDASDPICFINP